jgi:regulator of nucleoside diphosphate kinase
MSDTLSKSLALPKIVIGPDDHETLGNLVDVAGHDQQQAAELLRQELARARIVPVAKLAGDVVRIGSRVRYRIGPGPERTVQLVLPYMADIALNRVSVLTPVGAALIGLSHGQVMPFTATDGRRQVLQVMEVGS